MVAAQRFANLKPLSVANVVGQISSTEWNLVAAVAAILLLSVPAPLPAQQTYAIGLFLLMNSIPCSQKY